MKQPALSGRDALNLGLDAIGLVLSEAQIDQLLSFVALLEKWGSVYNLTSIRDPLIQVERHLLDSLLVSPHLHGAGSLLDLGTGAGLPGIPLAIAHPDRHFCLLDASAKKIRFVRQALMELGLSNVQAEARRVEQFESAQSFDVILTRAFSSLAEIRRLATRLLSAEGRILALKAHLAPEELQGLEGSEVDVRPLYLPGSDVTRHLVIFR